MARPWSLEVGGFDDLEEMLGMGLGWGVEEEEEEEEVVVVVAMVKNGEIWNVIIGEGGGHCRDDIYDLPRGGCLSRTAREAFVVMVKVHKVTILIAQT